MEENVDALLIVSHHPTIKDATGRGIGKAESITFETTKEGSLTLSDFVKVREEEVKHKEKLTLTDDAKDLLRLIVISASELGVGAGLFAFAFSNLNNPYLSLLKGIASLAGLVFTALGALGGMASIGILIHDFILKREKVLERRDE